MLAMQPYPLDDTESAAQFLQQAMEERERLFAQFDAAMKEMRATGNPARFLYVRFAMLEYLAAAYATRNRVAFDAALASLAAHSLPDSASAAQLGVDLAAALASGRPEHARALAARVARHSIVHAPEDLQAQALAALSAGAHDRAAAAAVQLSAAVEAANLPRHDAGLLLAWAKAAHAVAALQSIELAAAVHNIMQLRAAHVNKLLSRWRKGQDTDLTAIDFWDSQTAALMSLADARGLVTGVAPASVPFADWRWAEGVREWA